VNGGAIARELFESSSIDDVASRWVDDAPQHTFVSADVDGDVVTVVIVGPQTGAPDAGELQAALVAELGRDVGVDVRLVIEERTRLAAGGG
ncbi:MAG: hypothetical protein AAGG08_13675, partial [Actinomycetota bacterium]